MRTYGPHYDHSNAICEKFTRNFTGRHMTIWYLLVIRSLHIVYETNLPLQKGGFNKTWVSKIDSRSCI